MRTFRDESVCLADVSLNAPPTDYRELFRLEIEDFYSTIRTGRPSPFDPAEALVTNVIVDAILTSAQANGREVVVAVPENMNR